MLAWNAQRVEPEGPDLEMSVCGDCLYRYKYVKDFCPACFKPYATDDSMLPLLGPVVVVPDGAPAAGANTTVKDEAGADMETEDKNAGFETEAAVMCGECVEPALVPAAAADSEAMDVEGEGEAGDSSVVDTDKEEATTITASTSNVTAATESTTEAAPPVVNNVSTNGSSSSSASGSSHVENKSTTNSDELSEDNMVRILLL